MKDILTAPFVKEMKNTTANMYRLGWDERNGGNISYMLDESEVAEYLDLSQVIRTIPTGFDAKPLIGKIFIVTGTGKYFKNVQDDPENRVVMHSHPTNTLAMNFVHELDEKKLTHTLWEMCTECIVVFPDGVGVLPWMLCGNNQIGQATAKKMEEFRLVIWGMHGIYGAGKTMDETFGLIETVEKAAQIYMLTAHMPRINTIKDSEMMELAEAFGVEYRKDFLDL